MTAECVGKRTSYTPNELATRSGPFHDNIQYNYTNFMANEYQEVFPLVTLSTHLDLASRIWMHGTSVCMLLHTSMTHQHGSAFTDLSTM